MDRWKLGGMDGVRKDGRLGGLGVDGRVQRTGPSPVGRGYRPPSLSRGLDKLTCAVLGTGLEQRWAHVSRLHPHPHHAEGLGLHLLICRVGMAGPT